MSEHTPENDALDTARTLATGPMRNTGQYEQAAALALVDIAESLRELLRVIPPAEGREYEDRPAADWHTGREA